MAFQFIQLNNCNVNLRCTIQSTGKLGFTRATAEALHLEKDMPVKFAQDTEDASILYMVFAPEKTEDSFSVIKSGSYFTLPTRGLFEMLQYDYKNRTIIFDMVRAKELDIMAQGMVYKMKRRIIEKRTKTQQSENQTNNDMCKNEEL